MALPSFAVDPGGERLRHLSCEDCSETAPLLGPGEGPTPRRVLSREDWSISTTPCLPDPPSTMVWRGKELGCWGLVSTGRKSFMTSPWER